MKHLFAIAFAVSLVACGQIEGVEDLQQAKSNEETEPTVVYKPCVSDEVDEGVLITCADDTEPVLVRHGRDGDNGHKGDKGDRGNDGETVVVEKEVETVIVEHTSETVIEVDNDTLVYLEDGTAVGELVTVIISPLAFLTELSDGELLTIGSLTNLPTPRFYFDSIDCSGEPIAMSHIDTAGQLSTVLFDDDNDKFYRRGEKSTGVEWHSRRNMAPGSNCESHTGTTNGTQNAAVEYHGIDDLSFTYLERPYIGK